MSVVELRQRSSHLDRNLQNGCDIIMISSSLHLEYKFLTNRSLKIVNSQ
jgi:hypothetical protein